MSKFWHSLGTLFKRYFISGLLVIIPVVGTIWILKVIVFYADDMVMGLLPYRVQPKAWLGYDIPGLGFFLTIGVILIVGVATRLYVGRKFVRLGEYIISKVPVGRSIYKSFKQFMGAFITDDEGAKHRRVVAVEYPRRGCYMVGFVVGPVQPGLQKQFDEPWITIFLPTSPNPTSGYMISVPEKDTIRLPISTDEAFKYIISGNLEQLS
jgi:uncharacterized membrane protein